MIINTAGLPEAGSGVSPVVASGVLSSSSPTIDYMQVAENADEGETVYFSALASDSGGGTLTYNWDFGDGTSDSGVDLVETTHVYDSNNPVDSPYTVTLTVSNGSGSTSESRDILIHNLPPTVNAGGIQATSDGDTTYFSGSSTDPGGSGDIVAVEWDFDYDGTFSADASGTNTPSHSYSEPGLYPVAMRVTDRGGESATGFTSATVHFLTQGHDLGTQLRHQFGQIVRPTVQYRHRSEVFHNPSAFPKTHRLA